MCVFQAHINQSSALCLLCTHKKNRPRCVCACVLSPFSCLSKIPWTITRQAPRCVGFSRQEYWSGLPCSPPDPGMEPASPALQADSLPIKPPQKPCRFTDNFNIQCKEKECAEQLKLWKIHSSFLR